MILMVGLHLQPTFCEHRTSKKMGVLGSPNWGFIKHTQTEDLHQLWGVFDMQKLGIAPPELRIETITHWDGFRQHWSFHMFSPTPHGIPLIGTREDPRQNQEE